MVKFIRYALATICFAASVGCLALWWRSMTVRHSVCYTQSDGTLWVEARRRYIIVTQLEGRWTPAGLERSKRYQCAPIMTERDKGLQSSIDLFGQFGAYRSTAYFPLWYPALIFALAGVGVVRFRRQFSIRSALIATTVVAALIGMAVIL